MIEYISDRELGSIEEPSMAAYAGLTVTDGGICLQRTEFPQTITQAGAINSDTNNFADGPTKQITSIDSTKVDLSNASVTINTADSDTNNFADGPTKQITSIDSPKVDLSNASVTINTTDSGEGGKGVTWEGPTYSVNPETKDRINGEDIVVTIIDPETDLGEGGKGVTWEGPTYSLNYPESTDTTPKAYKMVLVEDGDESNPGHYKLVPVIDTTNDSSANNYLDGPTYSLNYPESTDTNLFQDKDNSNLRSVTASPVEIDLSSFNFQLLGNKAMIFGYSINQFSTLYISISDHEAFYINQSFIDAEKTAVDSQLCWAAAAANALFYTGWLTTETKNEDDVFSSFRNGFEQYYGGKTHFGYEWYLGGTYGGSVGMDQPISSGGFFSSALNSSSYYSYYLNCLGSSSILSSIMTELEMGNAVTIAYGFYDSAKNRQGGHAVTMWGYTCNTNISSGSSGYYKGIIYTDSDDSIVASGANPALAPDALKIWNIDWDTEYNGYRLVSPLTFGNNNYVAVLDYYTVLHPASFTTLSSGGAVVSSAATLLGKTVESGYIMDVSSAGLAMDTTVTSGGIMNVLSGGSATNIVASNGAHLGLTVAPDTYASGSYNSSAFIMSSASISNYTIHSGCTLDVLSGGSANNTTVDSSGGMNVLSGGTATNISASSGALLGLAVAPNTYASGSYGGTQFEVSANSITSYTVQSGCSLDVLTGGVASDTTVLFGGMLRFAGGTAQGVTTISSGGKMSVALPTTIGNGMNVSAATGAIVDFDISNLSPANTALINNLSLIQGAPDYSITVSGTNAYGLYTLADGAPSNYSGSMELYRGTDFLGTLSVGGTILHDYKKYLLKETGSTLSLNIAEKPIKSDRDHNRISDVMLVWTGNNNAHGYWMNGTDTWWSANAFWVDPDWDNLGSYDMSGDGKADAVMFGNVVINNARGAYIGYYQDGDDANGWVTIGYLDNAENIDWKNKVGNLTGNASGANSIVWYAPDMYALGAWTDGTDTWVGISEDFGGPAWNLAGCGDFDGDGKDSVLMSYNASQYYIVDLDGTVTPMGSSAWYNCAVRAIGDFAGDGKEDIVLFDENTGSMYMLLDGNADNYQAIGQLDPTDWFVAGCGDYNADGKDDLLVRQYSTGMLGYYSEGILNGNHWEEMGTLDSGWTVIA